jgi:hypothetical protein
MDIYYLVLLVFASAVALLTWRRVKNEADSALAAQLKRAFPWFMGIVGVGAIAMTGSVFVMRSYELSETFGVIGSIVVVLFAGALGYYFRNTGRRG